MGIFKLSSEDPESLKQLRFFIRNLEPPRFEEVQTELPDTIEIYYGNKEHHFSKQWGIRIPRHTPVEYQKFSEMKFSAIGIDKRGLWKVRNIVAKTSDVLSQPIIRGISGEVLAAIDVQSSGRKVIKLGFDPVALIYERLTGKFDAEEGENIRYFKGSVYEKFGLDISVPETDLLYLLFLTIVVEGLGLDETCFYRMRKIKNGGGVLSVTYDLDAVTLNLLNRLRKGTLVLYDALKSFLRGEGRRVVADSKLLGRLFLEREHKNLLEKVGDVSSRLSCKPLCFVFSKPAAVRSRLKDMLLQEGYCLDTSTIDSVLKEMDVDRGLHISLRCFRDPETFLREKRAFEERFSIRLSAVRYHWLKFSLPDTWSLLAKNGIETDSSFAFIDRNGFKAGTVFPYYLSDETSRLVEVPLCFMDMSFLLNGRYSGISSMVDDCVQILEWVFLLGGHSCINWHPETMGNVFGWDVALERILQTIGEKGMELVPGVQGRSGG